MGRISVKSFNGVFWTIPAYDYKVSGLMLIINFLGVKRDNLGIISGLFLSSFILNYMTIRVKEKGFE